MIRLSRAGKRNDPFYRVVALDKRAKRDGKNLEVLGTWMPKKKLFEANKEKIAEWLKKGAQLSPKVKSLLASI